MRAVFDSVVKVFSSLGLTVVLLLLLGLLTWFGTLEQVHMGLFEVQKKYFESFFLVHETALFPIPLPGANLVLTVLFFNILIGGIVRMKRSWAMTGIFVTHAGIAFLLLAGFIKLYHSEDGHLTLYEGEESNVFQSYYRWEIAVTEDLGNGQVQEHLIPQEDFFDARGPRPVTLSSPDLPFDLLVSHFMENSRPLPKGPMFEVAVPVVDGAYLELRPNFKTAEANRAGAYVDAVSTTDGSRQEGILWGSAAQPWTVSFDGRDWAVDLRRERYLMPFTIELAEFTKEEHPRTNMPSMFASDVVVTEAGSTRPVEISMNEPLRDEGLVLYQASWGPQNARPGERLFSTLSVVRNPADQYPLYACIVISIGLLLHFMPILHRYVRSEGQKS